MEDADPGFMKKMRPGDILVGGENFGCGSSREHAPIAIKAAGIACVAAKSFARIFYRNSFNMGLPIFESPELWGLVENGAEIEVDADAGLIRIVGAAADPLKIPPVPPFMQQLIADGGLMNHIAKGSGEMKPYRIAVLPGDGIGPEIVRGGGEGARRRRRTDRRPVRPSRRTRRRRRLRPFRHPLPDETMQLALASDAVLLGAVGGPKWESLDYSVRPERGLLGLRSGLGLYANLRPVVVFEDLIDASPLKPDVVRGIDLMIVRELLGDAYFGKPRGVRIENGLRIGINTMVYTEEEIRRIAKTAFDLAQTRRKKLLSVDKANVLEMTELWRDVVTEVGPGLPGGRTPAHVRGQLRDAVDPEPRTVRRDRDDEHVRRHPERRGVDADRLAGDDPLREPRGEDGDVRAEPRLRPGYRREGDRQPARHDPLCGDDAPPLLR